MRITGPAPGNAAEVEHILRALPAWFGLEQAILDYAAAAPDLDTWSVRDADRAVGFLAIKSHGPKSAELHVMGVLHEHQRAGLGSQLVETAEAWLRDRGTLFLQVKTLSPSCENEPYARTRAFYEAQGFVALEEFPTLWGEENPCLVYVKSLA